MKKIRFLITIVFLFFFINTSAMAAEINRILRKSIEAVVAINIVSSSADIIAVGSGVIIKEKGLILTNNHVINNHTKFTILTSMGVAYSAKLLISDHNLDLALLQIEDLEDPLHFFDTKVVDYDIGDMVYAIGNPRNVGISVSRGIVSALPSTNNVFGLGNLIQSDAAVNPGSSGGALIDERGNLIGINTFIVSNTSGFTGISFSVPIKTINLFVSRFLSGKKIKQYWVGIVGVDLDSKLANQYGLKIPRGVLVTQINPKSPALQAGLKNNDIILKFSGSRVTSMADLLFLVASIDFERPIKISIWRNNEALELLLTPAKTEEVDESEKILFTYGVLSGITIINNTNAVAYYLNTNFTDGVVVYNIAVNSYLGKLGVKIGDFIESINDITVFSVQDVERIVKGIDKNNAYKVSVKRGNTTIDIAVSQT